MQSTVEEENSTLKTLSAGTGRALKGGIKGGEWRHWKGKESCMRKTTRVGALMSKPKSIQWRGGSPQYPKQERSWSGQEDSLTGRTVVW